ncbi:ATP-binding protein [Nocardia panacis]|uniref:ATP-binding protein n=1 Tax=Nocardia panacis TaxID=2340916 RepID=A0A3A4K715_9NOCA|nr:ATP-binding protein [Nocardia panacis]RJO74754.1 ATP-binding protein [Nocardia panacis]
MIASSMLDAPRSALFERLRAHGGRVEAPVREPTLGVAASDRIQRRMGLVIGIGGTLAAVVELPEILSESIGVSIGWIALTMLLTFGLCPVLAVVSVRMRSQVIAAVAAAAATGFLLASVVAPFAYRVPAEDMASLWLYRLLVLGVLMAVLAWPPRYAVAYLILGSTVVTIANVFVVQRVSTWTVVGDFSRAMGLAALFLWCAIYARAAAARVDRESALESRRAAAVAGAAARDRERARFAALIHDAVLSTLLDASRAGTESPVLRRQAERTLGQLDEARGGDIEPDLLDAQSAIGFLRVAVHELNEGIDFSARRWPGFDDLRLPVAAASAIAAALAEAVRNSLRHAGVPGQVVRRAVTVTVSAGGIRVVFRDDGVGFEMGRVSPDRLGISVSILGRMRQLSGGAGFVESALGDGTTVTLVWGSDG